jgi:tetratricopeptide (TPR) repeat protein
MHDDSAAISPTPQPSPRAAGHPLGVALGLLRADAPERVMGSPGSWPRWAVLLPHVLAAADHLETTVAPDEAMLGDVAWLLDRAGTYLQVRAQLADARALLERALAIDEAAYGPDHPHVATNLNNLALTLQDLGQPEQSRPLLERALAIVSKRGSGSSKRDR